MNMVLEGALHMSGGNLVHHSPDVADWRTSSALSRYTGWEYVAPNVLVFY